MNNLKAKLKKQGGFTLIEMLIVVAIIAILVAISIPLVNKALEDSREATDAANERAALGLAMVEVLSDGTLGGHAPSASTAKVYAEYKIENSKGSLISGSETEITTGTTKGYGKGTAVAGSFNVTTSRVNQVIVVTYDPSASSDDAMFTTKWVAGAST